MPVPDKPLLVRLAAAAAALALGWAGFVLFALGGCHGSGGFCSGDFAGAHVVAYALGVVLLSSAAGLLVRTATRRRVAVLGAAAGAALLLAVVALGMET